MFDDFFDEGEWASINFRIKSRLKAKYQKAVKILDYSTDTQCFTEHVRRIILKANEVKNGSD